LKKQISLIVLIAITTTIVISLFYFSEEIDNYIDENDDTKWIHSGPFAIDRAEYLMGHKIFLIAQGINPNDKGSIKLVKMDEYENMVERAKNVNSGKIIKEFKFDGEKSTEFNIYFSPNLSKILEICSAEDLPGDYQIIFEGTNYQSIKLKILNQYLPGTENMFESVC
jgi:hypothetical protein|tara:strand:- start:40 stop:543 length:504 start_codon:yes stop_codon:yes gene_type:complete